MHNLWMDWELPYVKFCVTAVLDDGRKLTAAVRGYSEVNIYMETVFSGFEKSTLLLA